MHASLGNTESRNHLESSFSRYTIEDLWSTLEISRSKLTIWKCIKSSSSTSNIFSFLNSFTPSTHYKIPFCAMLLSAGFLTLVTVVVGSLGSPATLDKRSVSASIYNDLVYYFQYASSAYSDTCAKPNGNTLVKEV